MPLRTLFVHLHFFLKGMKAQSVSRTVVSRTTREDPPPRGQRGAEALHPCDTWIHTVPLDPPVTLQKQRRKPSRAFWSNGVPKRGALTARGVWVLRVPVLSRGGLIKTTPSSFHLPPVSMPTTTSLHRPEAASSGNVASLSRLAATNIAPSTSAAWGWGSPLQVRTLRNVMSAANWTPPKSGRS